MQQPKLIVLEGADGVGKSTLGRFLAAHYNGFYFHATATKTLIPAMRDYQINLMENIEENVAAGRTVIMDRFWPSELIYGAIFRPDNPHGFSYEEIAVRCHALDTMYVMCFSATAVERHVRIKDPKHPYEDTDFAKIYASYQDFWEQHKNQDDFVRYDLEKDGANMEKFADILRITFNRFLARRKYPKC